MTTTDATRRRWPQRCAARRRGRFGKTHTAATHARAWQQRTCNVNHSRGHNCRDIGLTTNGSPHTCSLSLTLSFSLFLCWLSHSLAICCCNCAHNNNNHNNTEPELVAVHNAQKSVAASRQQTDHPLPIDNAQYTKARNDKIHSHSMRLSTTYTHCNYMQYSSAHG